MTTIQIVNTIIILALAPLAIFCYVFAQLFIQRFPSHQRAALEQFSRMAVRHVDLIHGDAPNKATLARAYASDLFRLSGLPVPHEDVLEIAISAATHEIEHG